MSNQIVVLSNGKEILLQNPKLDLTPMARLPGGKYMRPLQPIFSWLTALANSTGYNRPTASATDKDGNIYTAGHAIITSSNSDGYVAKFDSRGVVQWKVRIGVSASGSWDLFNAIACDTDAIYVAGYSYAVSPSPSLPQQGYLLKLDLNGNILWQRRLYATGSTVNFNSIAIDPLDKSVRVAGVAVGTGQTVSGTADSLIAKYSATGSLLWQRRYGSTGSDATDRIAIDSSGNCIAVGYVQESDMRAAVAKLDPAGSLLWGRYIVTPYADAFTSCTIDADDNIYVVGYYNRNSTNTYTEGVLLKFDKLGTRLWQKSFTNTVNPVGITSNDKGQLFILSWSGTYADITCIDLNGNVLWSNTARSAGLAYSRSAGRFTHITHDGNGSLLVTLSCANTGYFDAGVVIKVPEDGSGYGSYSDGLTYSKGTVGVAASTQILTVATPAISAAATTFSQGSGQLADLDSSAINLTPLTFTPA